MTKLLPGLLLALLLALAGQYLSHFIGIELMSLPKSPVSAILVAILLGIIVRNTLPLPRVIDPGIAFSLKRVLRFGIVLLGIRLSLGEVGAIGVRSLPVIVIAAGSALLVVTALSRRFGLGSRLGTLIAVGTSICGATAIVATAPAIGARDQEVAYSIACITIFGVLAMVCYPFLAHMVFSGNAFAAGLFLGTSVHETAQVAGAGLVYQELYSDPRALDVATVTKLVRNLGMLIVIPLMSVLYHRRDDVEGEAPGLLSMVPLFVVGFALMSLLRTVGDIGPLAFGLIERDLWSTLVGYTRELAEISLAVAMAAVGLNTRIGELMQLGLRPFAVGLFAAALVGVVAVVMIFAVSAIGFIDAA
ncbi:MAG: putative sulfate exporter family transporter [Gammaproteobacteria bacterium]|nr:putative sulfate exporter family transporter [Gammaproteobacteria bacterium]